MYWQRVDVEDAVETRTATGAVVSTWSTVHADVEARVLPVDTTEKSVAWATPEEAAHEVHLRGRWDVDPTMRVMVDGVAFDVRRVLPPPPFGTPTTVLQCVRVTP